MAAALDSPPPSGCPPYASKGDDPFHVNSGTYLVNLLFTTSVVITHKDEPRFLHYSITQQGLPIPSSKTFVLIHVLVIIIPVVVGNTFVEDRSKTANNKTPTLANSKSTTKPTSIHRGGIFFNRLLISQNWSSALLERRRLQSSAAFHKHGGAIQGGSFEHLTAGWLDRCKSSCTNRCLALRH